MPHVAVKKALAFLGAFLLGLFVGLPIGAQIGIWEFVLADAQYKAANLSNEIKSLKAGEVERVLTGKEILLNAELAMHGRYMESWIWWLSPAAKPTGENAVRRAVAYRIANPYQGTDFADPRNWGPGVEMDSPFVKQVIEGQLIEERYLRKVLESYGRSPQPTPPADSRGQGR